MNATHFDDDRIKAIYGGSALTADERAFLLDGTPTFEECGLSRDDLSRLSDGDLMREAYSVWADYVACM